MIKYPGSDIALWTLLFIAAGAFFSYDAFAAGKMGLGLVFALLPVGCVLIWFDVRAAKWLVILYLGIALLGAASILLTKGFSWGVALRALLAAVAAIQFATWNGNPASEGDS